eukprot:TRINITY_DN40942_c0_g1_i1.p2 TRINITY_DN40942_c0_g1~~TRINITY_DN40942_c0_g1_i1.p2  ORF type:complete len:108 (+),score=18.64 TRINITY_DN40942_c0_g1_i1:55-378(+)
MSTATMSTSAVAAVPTCKVWVKPAPSAPALKKQEFKTRCGWTIMDMTIWLRKQLRMRDNDYVAVYCTIQKFAPHPGQLVGDLFEHYAVGEGQQRALHLIYSTKPAYG